MRYCYSFLILCLISTSASATIYEVVATDTVSNGTIFSSDTQIVHGTVNNFLIEGTQNILDYGKVYNNTVSGTQNIYTGGSAFDTSANSAEINVYSGGLSNNLNAVNSKINLYSGAELRGNTILQNSFLYIYNNNQIQNLDLNNATIIKNQEQNLSINALSGNGKFLIKTNLSNNTDNLLNIVEGNGNFGLSIIDTSTDYTTPDKINILPKNSQNQETFYLIGNEVDIGAKKYILAQDNNFWYLQETLKYTDTALIAKDTYATLSSILYSHQDNIYTRMGEFRFIPQSGFWARGLGKKLKFELSQNTKIDIDILGFQIGADYKFSAIKLGISGAYTDSEQKFSLDGNGVGKTYSVSLYATFLSQKDSYLDIIGTYYRHNQKLKSFTPSKYTIHSEYNLNAYSFSAQLGHRLKFKNGYFIEPQFQGLYMNIDNIAYKTTLNTLIQGYGLDSTMLRAGMMFGTSWQQIAQTHILFDIIKEFDTKSKIKVANTTFNEKLDGTFFKISSGFNIFLSQKSKAFFNVSTMFGNDNVKIPIETNLGIKWEF